MQTTHTLVVTDVARPADLVRCLTQARRTVPREVELVVITAEPRRLPPGLARAARLVRVASGAAFTAAVTAEAERDRLVVVARSDCRFADGWFTSVVTRTAAAPHVVGGLGGADPHLLAFPAGVRSTSGAQVAWAPVPGVELVGGTGRPAPVRTTTISASLIVKDEEAVLGDCLTALEGVVDEVVVYDTGSTDRTVEVAREHGATVHLGHWDDHFGDARNRALEHATCEWVLHVDADEVFTGDPAALRARLAAETADLVRVVVVSTSWKDATQGQESRPVRLFRRELFTWTGALHEYVVPKPGVDGVTLSAEVADVRLLHSGYHRATFSEKDKGTRNVDIARAATEGVAPDDPESASVWSNYGRALAGAGRYDEALVAFEHLTGPGGNATAVASGARVAVNVLTEQRRWDDVERWLDVLAAHGEAPGNLAAVRARRLLAQGDPDGAEAELDAIETGPGAAGDADTWGAPHDAAAVRRLRVRIAADRGLAAQALALLRDDLAEHPETVDVDLLLRTALDVEGSLEPLAAASPEGFTTRSLREVFGLAPGLALQWFEALVAARPGDVRVLVAGSVAAARADLQTALTWSVRAREAGQPELCALRRYAGADGRAPVDAAVAWAILADAFGEGAAGERLHETAAALAPDDQVHLLAQLRVLTPDLADEVAAAPGSPTAALRERLRSEPGGVDLGELAAEMDAAGISWDLVLAGAPEGLLDRLLREAVGAGTAVGLRWCEAFAASHPGDHRPVVAGCVVAGRADLPTALAWTARAREAGLPQLSPLRTYADADGRHVVDRAVALAVLADAFDDAAALAQLRALQPAMGPRDAGALRRRCAQLGVQAPASGATTDLEEAPC